MITRHVRREQLRKRDRLGLAFASLHARLREASWRMKCLIGVMGE